MPNSRILNTIPNSRVSDVVPNSRVQDLIPNSRILNDVPRSSVSSFQTGRSGEQLPAAGAMEVGTPIGLLLVLTHATFIPGTAGSLVSYSDDRPIIRVENS